MQTIYLGPTKKVGDIDLKKYRVYTERPTEIIDELKKRGVKLADKIFVPVENYSGEEVKLSDKASPIAVAYKNILEVKA